MSEIFKQWPPILKSSINIRQTAAGAPQMKRSNLSIGIWLTQNMVKLKIT